MSFNTRIARLKHGLDRPGEVRFMVIINSPEYPKLGVRMASNREAMIDSDHFVATPEESTHDFHARLREIAKARGADHVVLGHPDNVKPVKKPVFAFDDTRLFKDDDEDLS